jgi:mono/diheme cytochrome c family protein
MPAWSETAGGLRKDEIAAIIAHLRQTAEVGAPTPVHLAPRWINAEPSRGKELFTRHCAGCHGAGGEGLDAPALNNPILLATATDDYLVETIVRGRRGTAMHGFLNPSTIYPILTPADIESIVAYLRTWETRK